MKVVWNAVPAIFPVNKKQLIGSIPEAVLGSASGSLEFQEAIK
jgi:hypothetical protein